MATQQQQEKASLVAGFLNSTAPKFHPLFDSPSELNMSTMQYDMQSIHDLRSTLQFQPLVSKFGNFTTDLTNCSWEQVHQELQKARIAAVESERRGKDPRKNPVRWFWRGLGATSTVLEPGLAAIPDEPPGLCVLKGGLALVFSLARHSELNRLTVLAALETLPNIVEIAQNKMKTFPVESGNPKSIELHKRIQILQARLLETLPLLINKLVPGSFTKTLKKPFGKWQIDQLLEHVTVCSESVRVCSDSIVEDTILGTYENTKDIKTMMIQILEQQRIMQMQIGAAGKTHLFHLLLDDMSQGFGMEQADFSSVGSTALPGYTAQDLLRIIEVHHLRAEADSALALRKGDSFEVVDTERAAYMIKAPQVRTLLFGASTHSVVAVDGHFDTMKMGQLSPLSHICAMITQLLKQQSENSSAAAAAAMNFPGSPQVEKGPPPAPPPRSVVLEYYCSLHIAEDDDLQGPQGLIRCLTTQLILSLLANGWMGPDEAVNLPHLRENGEEELLNSRDLGAVYRLFIALIRIVPQGVSIYCIIDGLSIYERQDPWQGDYNDVMATLIEATAVSKSRDGRPGLKLLLTSPTLSRWLSNFVPPGQKVSLRNRDGSGNWRGGGRGGLMNMARAATMANTGFVGSGGFQTDEYGRTVMGEGYDRRSST
ncbi:hypothetical protein B0H63DRAFT_192787 [Podospora didyma]|uniref:Uncharacterized protein n=1 Tax=Podospora didyma TaxID=330526 RepID=A0AAE0U0C4_9PEZI|nr:hypothetical protein B0H63DRAFT_192787 [Podospora didyma]